MKDPIRDWQTKRQAQREQDQQEARDRHNERQRERARLAYLALGGDDEGFTKEWPTLQKELFREKTIEILGGNK